MKSNERQCTVTFDWVTDFTVVEVHINSHGRTKKEAIEHAAQALRQNWGDQIAITCDKLLDPVNIGADMRRNWPEVTWGDEEKVVEEESTGKKGRKEAQKDEDTRWQKMKDEEFKGTIEGLAHDYPGTVDYHTEDGEWFQLLDKDDNVIATISEREMIGYMG